MANVLEDYKRFKAFNEAYEVVKTVELVGYDSNMYCIQVLRSYSNPNCLYCVDYFEQGFKAPTLKDSNGVEIIGTLSGTWVRLSNMPWVCANTAEDALKEALSFLSEPARLRKD